MRTAVITGITVGLGFVLSFSSTAPAKDKSDLSYTIDLGDGIPVPVTIGGVTYTTTVTGLINVNLTYQEGTGFLIYGDVDLQGTPVNLVDGGVLEQIGIVADYQITLQELLAGSIVIEADGTFSAVYVAPDGSTQDVSADVKATVTFTDGLTGPVTVDIQDLDIEIPDPGTTPTPTPTPTPASGSDTTGGDDPSGDLVEEADYEVLLAIDSVEMADSRSVRIYYTLEPYVRDLVADAYLAVVEPGGEFLFVDSSLKTTGKVRAVAENLYIESRSGGVRVSLGKIRDGQYAFYAALVSPGEDPYDSSNWLSNLEIVNVTF